MRSAGPLDIDDPSDERGLSDRQLAVLDRLTDMGMAIAEAIHREIEAGLSDETDPAKRIAALNKAAVAHARAARAVRLAIALQARLLSDDRASASTADDNTLTVRWMTPEEAGQDQARDRGGGDPGAASEHGHGRERDRERDDLAALLRQPPAELIARICRDLGLDGEMAHRFSAAWAEASARQAGQDHTHRQDHREHPEDCGGPEPAVAFHPLL